MQTMPNANNAQSKQCQSKQNIYYRKSTKFHCIKNYVKIYFLLLKSLCQSAADEGTVLMMQAALLYCQTWSQRYLMSDSRP